MDGCSMRGIAQDQGRRRARIADPAQHKAEGPQGHVPLGPIEFRDQLRDGRLADLDQLADDRGPQSLVAAARV